MKSNKCKFKQHFYDYFKTKEGLDLTRVEVCEYCLDFHKFMINNLEELLEAECCKDACDLFFIGDEVLKKTRSIEDFISKLEELKYFA